MMHDTLKELQGIAERYKKHGITLSQLQRIAEGAPEGATERAAINIIRMTLANEYGEKEYFTLNDIAEITGETIPELQSRIDAMGIDTMQISSIIPGLFT